MVSSTLNLEFCISAKRHVHFSYCVHLGWRSLGPQHKRAVGSSSNVAVAPHRNATRADRRRALQSPIRTRLEGAHYKRHRHRVDRLWHQRHQQSVHRARHRQPGARPASKARRRRRAFCLLFAMHNTRAHRSPRARFSLDARRDSRSLTTSSRHAVRRRRRTNTVFHRHNLITLYGYRE